MVIELLHPDARRPERATEASAGYDLCAYLKDQRVSCSSSAGITEMPVSMDRESNVAWFEIQPDTTAMIPLGFKARLPAGYEAQIRPRSGTTFRKGLMIPNAPGTVDADYPDEWKVLVRNPGSAPVRIDHGERIAQMVLARYAVLPLENGVVARTTSRAGGFGSTGS